MLSRSGAYESEDVSKTVFPARRNKIPHGSEGGLRHLAERDY